MANGSTYEGLWDEGLPHGLGKMALTTNGEIYEGEFVKGKRYGKGKLIMSTSQGMSFNSQGQHYEGDFKENLPNG